MERIAVSISHEAEYAVAIAFGIRMAGGRFVFPPDIEERLDERERRILERIERLRATAEAGGAAALASDAPQRRAGRRPPAPWAERSPVGFGRRTAAPEPPATASRAVPGRGRAARRRRSSRR